MRKAIFFLLFLQLTMLYAPSYAQEEQAATKLSVYQEERNNIESSISAKQAIFIKDDNLNVSPRDLKSGIDFHNAAYILKAIKENSLSEDNGNIKNIKSEVLIGKSTFSKTVNQTYTNTELPAFTLGTLSLKDVKCTIVNDNYSLEQQNSKLKFNYTNKYYYIFDKGTNEYIGSVNYVQQRVDFLSAEYKFADINTDYLTRKNLKYAAQKETQSLSQPESLSISPNPANNNVSFHFFIGNDSKITLQLFNLDGRLLKNIIAGTFYNAGEYSYKEDFSELPDGNYLVKLITQNNLLTSKLSIAK